MDRLNWGIIGSLEQVKWVQADLAHATHPHQIKAVLLTDNKEAEQQPEGFDLYTNLHQFLQADIEAVYIASPYTMHYAQVKQCLLHQHAVLCERPIAQGADELDHLIRISEHNHTFLMEAMWIRFLPSIKKVLSIISSGTIGEIISVKATVNYKQHTERASYISSGGGALFELGVYPVFLCTLLLGQPEYVQASGRNNESGENEFFSAFLSYAGSQYGFIETSKKTLGTSTAVITGEKGTIQIKNPWSAKPEGIEVDFFDGTKVLHKSEWEGCGLYFELDEVFECLQQGVYESQLYSHHFSLDVMQTLDKIRNQLKS